MSYVTVAVEVPMVWSVSASPLDDVPMPTVTFEWIATMDDMRHRAMLAHDKPLRYEVSVSLAALLMARSEMPSTFRDIPVEVREGPFLRLVTHRRTYEVAL